MTNLQFAELEMSELLLVDGGGVVDDILTIGAGGAALSTGCKLGVAAATKTVVTWGAITIPGGLVVAASVVAIASGVTLIGIGVNSLLN